MEIVSPSPYTKPSIHIINNPHNTTHEIHHPYNKYNFNFNSPVNIITTSTTPKSPIQIQLPLHHSRPHHKKQTEFIKPSKKPTTTTTIVDVLRLMDALGIKIPIDMYISLIKECIETRDSTGAVELHRHIGQSGIRLSLPFLNRILLMYVFCGCMENAHQLFDKMPVKDSNSWAAMIGGYMESDDYEEAVDLFVEMQKYDYANNDILGFPGSWILVCILKACVHTVNLELGSQIHGQILKAGCCKDLLVSRSLINFYGKMGSLEDADYVFDQIRGCSTVIWTARIVNYCKEEQFGDVINVFNEMGREGVKKNSFTFSSVLKACANMGDDGGCGQQVHANVIKSGLVSKGYVQSALVNMYGRFGLLREARRAFEANGEKRNAACWNAMLSGYIRHGFCIEAIKILYEMQAAGLQPHESLLNEVRCVCGSINN
ncbi:hypothetical protein LguiB_028344 [Lonicera macranthoides]